MIYIFEIYDRRLKEWYIDYQTRDIKAALEYFYNLKTIYPKNSINVITKLDV